MGMDKPPIIGDFITDRLHFGVGTLGRSQSYHPK